MCLNCGCGEPQNDQGRVENITIDELHDAAAANHQTLRESAQHILEAVAAYERDSASTTSRGESDFDAGATDAGRHLSQPAGSAPAPAAPRGTPETES